MRQLMQPLCFSILIGLCVVLTSVNMEAKTGADSQFKKRMQSIEAFVVDLTSEFDVFNTKLFYEVWNEPLKYRKDALHFLGEEVGTETQKRIAVLAMQDLSLDDYLQFSSAVFKFWKAGKVSDEILFHTIFPGYDWNTKFQENYKNAAVRDFLIYIKNSGPLPKAAYIGTPFENYIDEILSGKGFAVVNELRGDGQLLTTRETLKMLERIRTQQGNQATENKPVVKQQ